MTLKVGMIAARSKPEAIALANEIIPWLERSACAVVPEPDLMRGASADILITLGGDGLIMRMAHALPGLPILGINVGKIGFLARIERSDWEEALSDVVAGRFRIQEGPTLQARLIRGSREPIDAWAINDVVIRSEMQMVDVELYVDQQFVNTYPGDGMIVATPQGSTAYCMAAGGPVLVPGVRGFAVTPICAHSPIRTTLVTPEEALIELIMVNDHPCILILDGSPLLTMEQGDLVQVTRGPHQFRLLVLQNMSFYRAFRSKFNFLIRPNAVPTRGADGNGAGLAESGAHGEDSAGARETGTGPRAAR
jgi:NAD+ kinase